MTQTRLLWIALIVAIGFGLSVEFLKSTRSSVSSASWRPHFFGLNDLEADDGGLSDVQRRVSSRNQADRARSRLQKDRVVGLDSKPSTPAPAPAPASVPANSANLAEPVAVNIPKPEDEAKKAADKKAEDDKKKKKREEKREKLAALWDAYQGQQQALATANSDVPKKAPDSFGNSGSFGGGGSSAHSTTTTAGAPVIDNPRTIEEWITYILADPNYDHTMKLILAQQQGTLESGWLHEIARQMLADPRTKMHEYAILALGSSPSLNSFVMLQTVNQNESPQSAARLQTRAYLTGYAKIENLPILATVVASGTTTTAVSSPSIYEAIRLIQVTVSNYVPKANTGTTVTISSVVTKQFNSLIPVLNRAILASTDATVRQEATQALQQINSLVGTSVASF